MGLMFGFVLYAGLIGWVAKVAEARGRIALGWAAIATVIGALGVVLGGKLVVLAVDSDAPDSATLLAALTPLIFLIVSMSAIVLVLQRLPIKTSSRLRWPVHNMGTGGEAGALAIEQATLRFEFPSEAWIVQLTALRTAKVDGECVRLSWQADGETRAAALLPRGKPDTPAGRRQQSLVIEQRLRERITDHGQVG